MRAMVVLADRATHVPEGAGTSGVQRTATVASRTPVGWARVLDWGGEGVGSPSSSAQVACSTIIRA